MWMRVVQPALVLSPTNLLSTLSHAHQQQNIINVHSNHTSGTLLLQLVIVRVKGWDVRLESLACADLRDNVFQLAALFNR